MAVLPTTVDTTVGHPASRRCCGTCQFWQPESLKVDPGAPIELGADGRPRLLAIAELGLCAVDVALPACARVKAIERNPCGPAEGGQCSLFAPRA